MTKILQIRKEKNISQEELALKSGVSRSIISALETGKSTVTTNITMQKIADALGETVSSIFFDEVV